MLPQTCTELCRSRLRDTEFKMNIYNEITKNLIESTIEIQRNSEISYLHLLYP